MASTSVDLEALLRSIAAVAPAAWYPKDYALQQSLDRDSLDSPLNDLRHSGLVAMTEWVRETGQGYRITAFGKEVLENPQFLSRLKQGIRPAMRVDEEAPEIERSSEGSTPTTYERGETVRNAPLFPEKAKVTPILIVLNGVAFLISLVVASRAGVPLANFLQQGDTKTLHDLGALTASDLIDGQWWRLLSCCFLHFGIFHLGMNLYSLYATGNKLEALWGKPRYLVLYLLCGLGGSTVAMVYDPGSPGFPKLLAGASGAIWGLMLSPVVWIYLNREFIPSKTVKDWMSQWWMIVLCNVAISFLPGISAAAHFGGGAFGIAVSFLLHFQQFGTPLIRQLATSMLMLIPFICFGLLYQAINNDERWQRIALVKQQGAEINQFVKLRKEVKPAFDKFFKVFDTVDDDATALIQRNLDKRDPNELEAIRKRIAELQEETVKLALLVPENNDAAGNVRDLKKAGRDGITAALSLLDGLTTALTQPPPEGAAAEQIRTLRTGFKKSRLLWKDAVNR